MHFPPPPSTAGSPLCAPRPCTLHQKRTRPEQPSVRQLHLSAARLQEFHVPPFVSRFLAATTLFAASVTSFAQTTPPPSWVYSSYFGGSGQDGISAQTRDSAGDIYVAGTTTSSDFPTTPGVYESAYPGPTGYNVVYVSKFSPEGALVWSTFVGPGTFQFAVTPSS